MKQRELWTALFVREQGRRRGVQLLLLVALAAAAGVVGAKLGQGAAAAGLADSRVLAWIRQFDATAVLLLGLLGMVRLLARPAADHRSGWLVGYIASGGSRHGYLLGLWAAVLASLVLAVYVIAPVFALSMAAAGDGGEALRRLPRVLLLTPFLLASMCAAATLLGGVTKDGIAAGLAACALVAVPVVAIAVLAAAGMLQPWMEWLLLLHLPPRPSEPGLGFVLQHSAYILVLGACGVLLADRITGRCP
jgi:hypothetical protein